MGRFTKAGGCSSSSLVGAARFDFRIFMKSVTGSWAVLALVLLTVGKEVCSGASLTPPLHFLTTTTSLIDRRLVLPSLELASLELDIVVGSRDSALLLVGFANTVVVVVVAGVGVVVVVGVGVVVVVVAVVVGEEVDG